MATISVSLPSDGSTADVADYNTPITTIVNAINGNLDNANIVSGAAIDGSKIASASLTNTQMATSVSPVTRWDEGAFDYVASGCVWSGDSYGSTLAASMTSGVVYIDGKRLTVAAVTGRAFTASKDTYVDLRDNGDGTASIQYNEVANNAASQALTSGDMRIAIIVSGGSSIANVAAINQGQEDKVLPIASSIPYAVTDSLGNLICPRDPNRKVLGYRQILSSASVTNTTTPTQVTGLTVPVIIPTGRKVELELFTELLTDTGNNNTTPIMEIWEGAVVSGTRKAKALVGSMGASEASRAQTIAKAQYTPSSTSLTYNAGIYSNAGTSNTTLTAETTCPAYLRVLLV